MNVHFSNIPLAVSSLRAILASREIQSYAAIGVGLLAGSWLYIKVKTSKGSPRVESQMSRRTSLNNEKRRDWASWTPVKFDYPEITPHPSNPLETEPIPYRPFRTGEYHVTMGIRTMPWNEWIELDNQYKKYHQIRSHRIATRGQGVVRILPENPGVVGSGAPAAVELVHEIAEYLSRRYPSTFQIERQTQKTEEFYEGWYGLPAIKSITVIPRQETYQLPINRSEVSEAEGEEALRISALLVQEDIALMVEGQMAALVVRSTEYPWTGNDGRYYFQAGAILVPGFWRMQDKIGLPLDEIHNSGNVPRYKEKLQMSMERFFQKLAVDKPVARNNYFFQVIDPRGAAGEVESVDPEELAWAESSHGPEDEYTHSFPAEQPTRPQVTPANIRLRTERQTLRRLPRSGAIVFGIRTYLTPIEQVVKEPTVAKRLAGALRGWGDDIGVYKGRFTGGWWDEVLRYLDDCSVGCEEIVETKYPF